MRGVRHLAELGLATVRAAGWALLALRRLRRQMPSEGLEVRVLKPPNGPLRSLRGVEAALRLGQATCLERSLVVQRWLQAHGRSHDVMIAVGRGTGSMEAHAWIHRHDPEQEGEGLRLLTRVAPRD